MPGTPGFGSPPGSPGGEIATSAAAGKLCRAATFGWQQGDEQSDGGAPVPKPPCSTPKKRGSGELVIQDELDAAIGVAPGAAPEWNVGPLGPPVAAGAIGRYRTLTQIGNGCFGTVHLAETAEGGKVAVKCVHPDEGREMREVILLRSITHPCVVPLLDSFKAPGLDGIESVHIVMEFLPENLHMRMRGRPVPHNDLQVLGFQLLRAMAQLDGMRICHRDVKPENILLDGPTLKLADFGSAKVLQDGGSSTSYICARWWRAPELVLGSTTYSTSSDWWSCGCVFAEMMHGRPLFTGTSNWGQLEDIVRVLGMPSAADLSALVGSGSGAGQAAAAQDAAERLRVVQSQARRWVDLLPTYAGMPDALEVPRKLLVFNPSARWHPTDAMLGGFFESLSSEAIELPVRIFDFTQEELTACTPEKRQRFIEKGRMKM